MIQKVNINIPRIDAGLVINLTDNNFDYGKNNEIIKFLKDIFRTKESFESEFVDKIRSIDIFDTSIFCNEILSLYDDAIPYTFKEAFEIENNEYRALIFGRINITDMITYLGAIRIAADGNTSMQKKYDKDGNYIETIEMTNIYEVYEVSGQKLNIEGNVYALKCWCTTTNKEHWLWIDEKYKDKPLEAVASTFVVHENIIPHIKELKRQGDILFAEMNENTENIKPEGKLISLTAEQYFKLLTAQS